MPSRTRRFAAVICGRRAKWIVVAIWLAVTVALGVGLGSQLTDEEDNAASSWLPDSAESTEALGQIDVFQSENTFPTTRLRAARRPDRRRPGRDPGGRRRIQDLRRPNSRGHRRRRRDRR
ncbi:MAG TPA: hypothetical protein VEX15_10730 [Nocardioidaceae bacterium]|nr:hypothetical protein [Nocardioidaceae bacterium]